jgi:hypothetical protein
MVNEVQNRVVRVWAAVSGAMHERRLASDATAKDRGFAPADRMSARRKRALTMTASSVERSAFAAAVNREANSPG